jgi:hypothetical protein
MNDKKRAEPSPQETVTELKAMVVDYAKQETVDPLKRLGDWLKWGLVGAILLAFGVALLTLGLLRVIQEEVDTFDGGKSWIPYIITFGALLVVLVMAGFGMKRSIDLSERSDS